MKYMVIILVIVSFIMPISTTAQDGWSTYTPEDESFSLTYPANWNLIPDEQHVNLTNSPHLSAVDLPYLLLDLQQGEIVVSISVGNLLGLSMASQTSILSEAVDPQFFTGYFSFYATGGHRLQNFRNSEFQTNPSLEVPHGFLTFTEPEIIDSSVVDIPHENHRITFLYEEPELQHFQEVTIIVFFTDEDLVSMLINTPEGEYARHEDTILAIIDSIVFREAS